VLVRGWGTWARRVRIAARESSVASSLSSAACGGEEQVGSRLVSGVAVGKKRQDHFIREVSARHRSVGWWIKTTKTAFGKGTGSRHKTAV
jgi:hypothetical protein